MSKQSNPLITDEKSLVAQLAQQLRTEYKYEAHRFRSSMFNPSKKYAQLSEAKLKIYTGFMSELKEFKGDLKSIMNVIDKYVTKMHDLRVAYPKKIDAPVGAKQLDQPAMDIVRQAYEKSTKPMDEKWVKAHIRFIIAEKRGPQPPGRLEKEFLNTIHSIFTQHNSSFLQQGFDVGKIYREYFQKLTQDLEPSKVPSTWETRKFLVNIGAENGRYVPYTADDIRKDIRLDVTGQVLDVVASLGQIASAFTK